MAFTNYDPFWKALQKVSLQLPTLPPHIQSKVIHIYSMWVTETLKNPLKLRYLILWSDNMANKSKDWKFARVSVLKADKPKIDAFAEGHDHDMQMMFDILADDGIKISMSYSEKRTAWCTTLTPKEDSKLAYGVSMSSWSNDPIEAFWISAYKHVILCFREDYPTEGEEEAWG